MKKTLFVPGACLLIPALIFIAFGLREPGLPGLYMDSVNPDYLAARLLGSGLQIPAWIYPDNLLSGNRFPLLNSLYGGNFSAYLGLPFFWIFGFGPGEVRVFHCLLALTLLAAMAWCLRQWRVSGLVCIVFTSLLAADPGFVHAWRTQYYLQLFPLIFMWLGLGLLGKAQNRKEALPSSDRTTFYAGVLLGFAAYGYFVFAFYAAAIFVAHVLMNRKSPDSSRDARPLLGGIFLGFAPYLYAHLSIAVKTGLNGYISNLKGLQTTYGVIDSHQGGILDRVMLIGDRLNRLIAGSGVEEMIFGGASAGPTRMRVGILVFALVPVLFMLVHVASRLAARARPQPENGSGAARLRCTLLLVILSHLVLGLAIGKPLGLQHYIMLAPIFYALSAALIPREPVFRTNPGRKKILSGAFLALALLALAFNLSGTTRISARLHKEGGSGFYSDAINITSDYLSGLPGDTAILFPQWGYWMGVTAAIGPRFDMYEASDIQAMEMKLAQDKTLQARRKFALVLGKESITQNDSENKQRVADFSARTRLQVTQITNIQGRNGVDRVWVVSLLRQPQ